MKLIYFIIILLIIILIISLFPSYKKEHMMEFVEPPAGVIVTIPAMQLDYCSTDKNLKNANVSDISRCYPYKCINKRGKITCRNEPCWIDEVYYNGNVECDGWEKNKENNKYICDNTYNKNYDCSCKKSHNKNYNINDNITKNKKSNNNINNNKNTICIDPCTYRYYAAGDYPCDVHYIQAIELEPDYNNYGNKICLINDDYEFAKRKKCRPLEVSLLPIEK